MITKLKEIEFEGNLIRGLLTLPNENCKKIIFCISGFGRTAVSEKKFKKFGDLILENNIGSFRFDFIGSGISDGEFKNTTVSNLTEQTIHVLDFISKEELEIEAFITHSLGGCVVSNLADIKYPIKKLILIAPALNQKDLQRYWFTQKLMKSQNVEINFQNYLEYFNNELFIKDMNLDNKMTKNDFIDKSYFIENMNQDYGRKLENLDSNKILFVQGLKDESVPLESHTYKPKNILLVPNGDHDLERPDMRDYWFKKAQEFILL